MIGKDELVPLLLEACPLALPEWNEELESWGGESAGAYNEASVFAHHVVESYTAGKTEEFVAFFELLERLLVKGDPEVQELASVGLIEDIQNMASHESHGYRVFERWLGPESIVACRSIESLWAGKSSLMDVLRGEAQEVGDADEENDS